MGDLFISYSRNDRELALSLAERMRSVGMNVWIDQSGIEAATSWSKEIVQAVEACKVFLLLLSKASLKSKNVVRELSIASECERAIIPIEIEPVVLPSQFRYQLAGIQRAQYSDFDGIVRALAKLGVGSGSGRIVGDPRVPGSGGLELGGVSAEPRTSQIADDPPGPRDSRVSLMVLPFEDLSPSGDNGWFADGLMSELIASLSHIKSLRLIDERTSREFKNVKVKLTQVARENEIRYFIEGSVRKFGDQIKISLNLLDIESGDYLWQYSHRGPFAEIFDIQEEVASKVVEGLMIHLTTDEEKKLKERGTDSIEAYELYLKAIEYYERHSKEGFEFALQLYREAMQFDPRFALAYIGAADALSEIYRVYDRNSDRLAEAERLIEQARAINPSLSRLIERLSHVRLRQGRIEEAEALARQFVALEPDNSDSYFTLGFIGTEANFPALCIEPFEVCLRLRPDRLDAHWNIVLAYDRLNDQPNRIRAAERAIPYFEKRNRQFPDLEDTRAEYANLLYHAGRIADAELALASLTRLKDGGSLYNLACLASRLKKFDLAVQYLKSALVAGFAHTELFRTDPDLEPLWKREDFQVMTQHIPGITDG